ncbi:MAG TPA: chemotaxis protein CheB [Polyangiaceae bacterium]|nr:chemotaxis protein CheB [Polyangiaceae bacterium]
MRIGLALADPRLIRTVERALASSEHQIAWSTKSAFEALQRAASECPELILVGVDMSEMTAAELTRRLLARSRAVVMLVANRRDATISPIYEAMGAGALDVLALAEHGTDAAETQMVLGKLRTARRLLDGSSANLAAVDPTRVASPAGAKPPPLIALGASTGGPQALLTILSALPVHTSAAVVIVQHVDAEFSQGLATWLEQGSGLRVELARSGASPSAGTVLVAGTAEHLVLSAGGTFRYTPEPRELAHRPSVDVLFESLARHWRGAAAAALLTGMGRDGASGLDKLKKAGWLTFAQDEASSVVYGMPKAAAQLGAAMKILSPAAIAAELALFAEKH